MPGGRPRKPVDSTKKAIYKASGANQTALAVVPLHAEFVPILDRPLREAMAAIIEEGATWLSVTDLRVTFLDELLEERELIRAAVMVNSGDRKALRDIEKSISESLSLLGFDPSARARLGLSEVQKLSTLETLKAKREASRSASETGN